MSDRKLFSERMGYVPTRPALQVEALDEPLRNRLLNTLLGFVRFAEYHAGYPKHTDTMRQVWDGFFKRSLPELNRLSIDEAANAVIEVFDQFAPWHDVYSLLEFVRSGLLQAQQTQFERAVNSVLAQELAGYRFVDGHITPITDEVELASLQQALETDLPPARDHMAKALALFAERESPNYAKVIQEAITAAETQLRDVTGKSTVSDGLAKLKKMGAGHHPAFLRSFGSLYGWTSDDKSGIRHAGDGVSAPTQALAKVALVTCSAFVNYLEELRATK